MDNFDYFFNKLNLLPETYKMRYVFNNISGNFLLNSASGQNPETFKANISGSLVSGNLTDTIIYPQGVSGLDSEFWTMIFIYEKTGIFDDTLFSNFKYNTNGYYQGFKIKNNHANRLYYESYDNNGPVLNTFNTIIGKKNLITISRSNNVINFSYFDFNNKNLLGQSFQINENFLFDSPEWTIGPLHGSMDQFILFKMHSPH
ncbi:MAG: hypothetical protein HC836_12610 [Richelia sp. RM2_1_2]|nr:hypothetical protein [Richelia sp. RM2_1_2]